MSLRNWQIENHFRKKYPLKAKAGEHKWIKQQRNRKIRRIAQTEKPNIKYGGWEY